MLQCRAAERDNLALAAFLAARLRTLTAPNVEGRERRKLALFPILAELLQEGSEIGDLLVILDAGKHHLGTGYFRLRILYVLCKHWLIPGDVRRLVGCGVAVALRLTSMAAEQAIQLRPYAILGCFTDLVAGAAFIEGALACGGVLSSTGRCRCCEDQE